MILRLSHMVRSLPQIELWIKLRQPEFAAQCFEFEADDNFHSREYTRHCILCKRISDIFLKMNDFGLGAYRFLRVPIVMGWEAFFTDWGKLPFRLIIRFPSLIGLIRERYQQAKLVYLTWSFLVSTNRQVIHYLGKPDKIASYDAVEQKK